MRRCWWSEGRVGSWAWFMAIEGQNTKSVCVGVLECFPLLNIATIGRPRKGGMGRGQVFGS